MLQRHAEDAGVKLEFGARRSAAELDADLVIAADGVGSATRSSSAAFGAEVETGSGWYLWAGTDVALDHALFVPERTEHGVFVTHAYPYAADRSTFLVETDEATWRSAGFDSTTAALGPDASDDVALDYLSDVFARHLGGHRLIGNRTRWLQFRTVRCARWHDGRTVLLGDAAHTAHYSVGSGTKLAMEDAIALVTALGEADDLETALTAYTAARRPVRGPDPGHRGALAPLVGLVPGAARPPRRAAPRRVHEPGGQRAAGPVRRELARRRVLGVGAVVVSEESPDRRAPLAWTSGNRR